MMLRQLPICPLLFTALLVSTCLLSRAADKGIGVTLVNYTLQATLNNDVNFGYTLNISARVKNFDTVPFSGVLDFGLRNRHQPLSSFPIFGKPRYSGKQIQLNGGEEVPAIFSVNIDPAYFIAPGPDVVVVWPISPTPIQDSIMIHINILDTTTAILDSRDGSFAYAILKDRILLFNTGSDQLIFKQVRFFDLMGRNLSDSPLLQNNEVPIPAQLPPGIYLSQLLTTDGKSKTIKFLK